MSSDSVCRSCVMKDVKMLSLDTELQEIYEKLTNSKVSSEDGMPKKVCFICHSHLQKCKRFSEVALRSEQLLKDWLDNYDNKSQATEPCKLLDLRVVENLSVTVANPDQHPTVNSEDRHRNNYICVTECPINVKIEVVEVESMKQETIHIKTEIIDEMDEEYDTDNVEATNEENLPNDTINTEDLFPKKKDKPFSCRKCDKAFFMSKNLIEHIKDCYVVEDLTCKICSMTFSHIGKHKSHMLKHSKARPFVCRCGRDFRTRADLSAHMKIHSTEKKYACEVCGKAFTLATSFKTHMMMHEGVKKFACHVCGKAFYTKGNLKSHMRCHTGERPFQCNTCGLTFGFKSSLKQHIRRLHTEVKPFPCDKCHLSFNQEVALTSHLRSHSAERCYRCDKCNKTFTSARNLKGHMDVHSQERPYSCTRCGNGFKRPEHLKQHLRSLKCKDNSDSIFKVMPEC